MKKMYDYWGAYDEDALENIIPQLISSPVGYRANMNGSQP